MVEEDGLDYAFVQEEQVTWGNRKSFEFVDG